MVDPTTDARAGVEAGCEVKGRSAYARATRVLSYGTDALLFDISTPRAMPVVIEIRCARSVGVEGDERRAACAGLEQRA